MKKLLLPLFIVVMLVNCSEPEAAVMTVSGSVKGLKKGVLYLQKVADSTLITLASLEIKGNGNFTFNTTLERKIIMILMNVSHFLVNQELLLLTVYGMHSIQKRL